MRPTLHLYDAYYATQYLQHHKLFQNGMFNIINHRTQGSALKIEALGCFPSLSASAYLIRTRHNS